MIEEAFGVLDSQGGGDRVDRKSYNNCPSTHTHTHTHTYVSLVRRLGMYDKEEINISLQEDQ